jgi:protoheme IX farnesyltransferase
MFMEKTSFISTSKTYWQVTKPGILMGNAITASGGFILASKTYFDFSLLIATLLGLSFIIASACVFNNYIDRNMDEKMERTKNRVLVLGLIGKRHAIAFAISLGLSGVLLLALLTNLLTVGIALLGFFVYVLLYSFLKYRSLHATLVGSIAGALPPVIGYCAVSNHLDLGAALLFIMIAMWQMPHFFAIAIYRLKDYTRASIPVLPIKKGIYITKIHMMVYIVAFMIASSMLTVFNYTGYLYLIVSTLFGTAWLCLCIQGITSASDELWARKMFSFSLVIVTLQCFMIPF